MPLQRYGVAIGSFVRFYRDPPNDFGSWYHGHIEIATPSGIWTSALDVDTPTGPGVSYRTSGKLIRQVLGAVATMPSGFHPLPSTVDSGAIDYIRVAFLQDQFGPLKISKPIGLPKAPLPDPSNILPPIRLRPSRRDKLLQSLLQSVNRLERWIPVTPLFRIRPWLRSDGNNALLALEKELVGNRKIYLFGQRFSGIDQGIHDVHQNQGDPKSSQWWEDNGPWQDGAVAVERENGTLFFWQVRFNSQAVRTDDAGHPLPYGE